MDEQARLRLLDGLEVALDPPPYDSRSQSPVPYNNPVRPSDWSQDPGLGIANMASREVLLEEIKEIAKKPVVIVHRIVDIKGNLYATVGDDNNLVIHAQNAPECLYDCGFCLLPCWCKCDWLFGVSKRLEQWVIVRKNTSIVARNSSSEGDRLKETKKHFQQSMSRLD
jgi:hypothetical protein